MKSLIFGPSLNVEHIKLHTCDIPPEVEERKWEADELQESLALQSILSSTAIYPEQATTIYPGKIWNSKIMSNQ